jgi:hypothetical protein
MPTKIQSATMHTQEAPQVPFAQGVLGPRVFEKNRTVRDENHRRGPSALLAKETINPLSESVAQHDIFHGDPIPEHCVTAGPTEECVPHAECSDPQDAFRVFRSDRQEISGREPPLVPNIQHKNVRFASRRLFAFSLGVQ